MAVTRTVNSAEKIEKCLLIAIFGQYCMTGDLKSGHLMGKSARNDREVHDD